MDEQTITVEELNAWQETAERHCRNEAFYRDIIEQLGPLLGPKVYTSDDGSVQDSVLALKVVEAVNSLRDRCNALEVALKKIEAQHAPMRGEAKPDPNRYCTVCVHLHTGRSAVWPCRTVKTVREALAEGESRVPAK